MTRLPSCNGSPLKELLKGTDGIATLVCRLSNGDPLLFLGQGTPVLAAWYGLSSLMLERWLSFSDKTTPTVIHLGVSGK